LNDNRQKFINFAEIGGKFINVVVIEGMCNMQYWLRGMDALVIDWAIPIQWLLWRRNCIRKSIHWWAL